MVNKNIVYISIIVLLLKLEKEVWFFPPQSIKAYNEYLKWVEQITPQELQEGVSPSPLGYEYLMNFV